jgi:hypothetical protein
MSLAISGTAITFPDASTQSTAATGFGFKNRIINGAMQLSQRATSATVTAGTAVPTSSTGYPCVDRFFVYSTGANVTAAQVAGSGAVQYRLQITGAASVTAVGVGQRIEQKNSYDMAGSTATLSVELANSALSTVTWTASYANTADTFGTIGTPTKTQIATGTFTVNSTPTVYSTQISIPAGATTGIEILFTVGAQTSGTFSVGQVQLTKSATLEAFDVRDIESETARCQRYFEKSYAQSVAVGTATSNVGYVAGKVASTTVAVGENYGQVFFAVVKRSAATVTIYGFAGGSGKVSNYSGVDQAANSGAANAPGESGFNTFNSAGATFTTTANAVIYHWTASAEIG